MKVKHIYILLLVLSFGIESCVKKNLKAIDDNNKAYDPDISLNQIFFSKIVDGNSDIFKINIDGSEVKNITNSFNKSEFYPAISHDAKRIAFASGDRLFQSAIDGTDEIEITNNSIFSTKSFTPTYLSWSDKSNFITFQDQEFGDKHYIDSQYDTKIKRSLTKVFEGDGFSSYNLSFSPIEAKVVFTYTEQPLGGTKMGISSLEGFESDLIWIDQFGLHPQYFKDGSKLLYIGNESIDMIDIDGENKKNLVLIESDISGFSASPDGTQIVYSSNISGNYELYILTIDSKEVTQLTNTVEDELHPFWN